MSEIMCKYIIPGLLAVWVVIIATLIPVYMNKNNADNVDQLNKSLQDYRELLALKLKDCK